MGERILFEGGLFMNKKFFTIGMAVLLGVSLSFLGCEDKAEETTEPTAAEKAAALAESADFKGKATVDGATVTLTADVTIKADISVEDGVKVDVSNKTLKVETGKKLTNNGTVTIKSGGTIEYGAGVGHPGTGDNVVEAGGTLRFNGLARAFVGANTDNAAQLKLTSGSFTYNSTGLILNGNVTLNDTWDPEDLLWIGSGENSLTIGANSTFTVPGGRVLRVGAGDSGGTLTFTDNTSKVVIEADSQFYVRVNGTIKATPAATNGAGVVLGVYATGALTTLTGFTSDTADGSNRVTLTTAATAAQGTASAHVAGNASFAVASATTATKAETVTSIANASAAAKGYIKAGTGTVIILTGKAGS
jgi:hypothetical protein